MQLLHIAVKCIYLVPTAGPTVFVVINKRSHGNVAPEASNAIASRVGIVNDRSSHHQLNMAVLVTQPIHHSQVHVCPARALCFSESCHTDQGISKRQSFKPTPYNY